MLEIKIFEVSPFSTNAILLYDETKECVMVDPATHSPQEQTIIEAFIKKNDLNVTQIWNTHGHIDHVMGNAYWQDKYNTKIFAHSADNFFVEDVVQYGLTFGLTIGYQPIASDFVNDGDTLKFGNSEFEVLSIPGHSPGSLAFYNRKTNFVIVGDVLFNGGIGRTDLPKGNYDQLINSINTRLLTLDSDTKVYSGHGAATSIGYEKQNNPFLK